MIKKLKVLWIYFCFKIKRKIWGKNYQTIRDYQKEWKRKNKSDIIRELTKIAGEINKGFPAITKEYKKLIRKRSKKDLIKALIELKIRQQFGGNNANAGIE